MTRYRYLDSMGDVIAEREFDDRAAALAWSPADADSADSNDASEMDDDLDAAGEEPQRVEYLGPEGDWRWAGVPGSAAP